MYPRPAEPLQMIKWVLLRSFIDFQANTLYLRFVEGFSMHIHSVMDSYYVWAIILRTPTSTQP